MKSIKYISVLLILLFTGVSCSDFLDKQPTSLTPETYFNTENELQLFLTGVYSPIMQGDFYGGNYALNNAGGDDLTFYQRSSAPLIMMCANANSGNPSILTFWRLLYDGANRANMLLENVDKNPSIAQTTRDRIRAEALFLRSFYYFNLVQGWGDVPMHLASTQTVTGLDAARVSKQVIYDQIIRDIIKAIPYLHASNELSYTGAVTQSAAKGILARIYLFRAGENNRDATVGNPLTNSADSIRNYYQHAKDWALEVKQSGLHGLVSTYSTVFIDLCQNKYNSTGVGESIWEAEEAGNRSTPEWAAGRLGNTLGFGAGTDYSTNATYMNQLGMANPGYSYRFAYCTNKLTEMYELDGDTARGNWNIANYEYTYAATGDKQVIGRQYFKGKKPGGSATQVVNGFTYTESTSTPSSLRCAAKYRREYEVIAPKNKNYTSINFPILRYSDILLMIAEADNELTSTPSDLAYECIDAVRTRAKISGITGGGLTKDQFRDAIKRERAMEFCFEGLRRWDLIRWGDFYKDMQEIRTDYATRSTWSTTFSYATAYFNVTSAYNYFPIPDAEMAVNKLITKNNPGW